MQTYDVGQVIYIVSSRKMQVMPIVIAEEVIRKTLSGQAVTYLVKRDETSKTYDLTDMQGSIYETINDVKEALVANATQAIFRICEEAQKKSNIFAIANDTKTETHQREDKASFTAPTDSELKQFVLDDGTRLHVNLQDI